MLPVTPARPAMSIVPLDEAQRRLPDLLDAAARGEEVVISRGDGADVRLVPVPPPDLRPRKAGSMKGLIHISDDFDDPLPEFEPYM